jgi:hypothetical protein
VHLGTKTGGGVGKTAARGGLQPGDSARSQQCLAHTWVKRGLAYGLGPILWKWAVLFWGPAR